MSCLVINEITGIEDYTYLELGVFKNRNFNAIKCKEKFSVDTNGNAMFTGTTDEYFSSIDENKKFDIIFIDANHDYDYVLRDFNNAIKHANKWVLIHDMIPTNEEYSQSHLCSDSYKLLYYFLESNNFQVFPMNENFGLTLIKMPAVVATPDDRYKNLTYKEFTNFIENKKLFSKEEIVKILED